ncbi:hypothetical protein RF11_06572 [Thelohanellus kitauei]|uniref:Reverse transcriptase domain-containing protein n=1 Tax=Thelohanellus kitauei TaxID=669202 RepID=A0A0C2JAC3_THEKT|nr:hypothetical protein RF11_06572 [Thelohanellus kitauei]
MKIGDHAELKGASTETQFQIDTRLPTLPIYLAIVLAEECFRRSIWRVNTIKYLSIKLYEFLRMSVGLKNAIQAFTRLINSSTQDLQFVFVYLDDILIFTDSKEEQVVNLLPAFERLQEYGLIINLDKYGSGITIYAVLEQQVYGHCQSLRFFHREMRPAEKYYSAFDRELRHFTEYTHHKSLTFAFPRTPRPWSSRQQRHFAFISEFTTCIKHVSGKQNVVAESLSPINSVHENSILPGIDIQSMALSQVKNDESFEDDLVTLYYVMGHVANHVSRPNFVATPNFRRCKWFITSINTGNQKSHFKNVRMEWQAK